MTTTRKYICDVCGLAGGQHTRIPHPFLTLAEWDNASEERRTAWIKTDRVLSPADAEILRLREVKDGEAGGRYPRIARGYTQCPHGATWYCEICNANEPEPRIIAECWTCCGNQEHIRKPHAEWPMCSHLKVEGYSERYCRAAGHDVREIKP